MAEAGSFADRVKQQADIVRVVGEYVRLKKTGQNFTGLCPFHSEKTPSFAVHPVKQIYHCFGCGVGGDVFKFVMEMEKCDVSGSGAGRGGKMRHRHSAARGNARRRSAAKISSALRWWKCIARRRRFLRGNSKSTPEGKAARGLSARIAGWTPRRSRGSDWATRLRAATRCCGI